MPQSPKPDGPTSDVWANRIILLTRSAEGQLYRIERALDTMQFGDIRPALRAAQTSLLAVKRIAEEPPLPF